MNGKKGFDAIILAWWGTLAIIAGILIAILPLFSQWEWKITFRVGIAIFSIGTILLYAGKKLSNYT